MESKNNLYGSGVSQYQALEKQAQGFKNYQQELSTRVGIPISDREYSRYLDIASKTELPDETMHRLMSATVYSRNTDIPFEVAYSNLETLYKTQLGRDYKPVVTSTQAIMNSFRVSEMNVENTNLMSELRELEKDEGNNRERISEINKTIESNYNEILNLKDDTPRSWYVELAKASGENLAYSAEIMKSGSIGAVLGGAVALGLTALTGGVGGAVMLGAMGATGAVTAGATVGAIGTAYNRSSTMAQGNVYYDLRQKGIDKEIAYNTSEIVGLINGAIEIGLDSAIGVVGGAVGLKTLMSSANKIVAKSILTKGGAVLHGIASGVGNVLGEGLEESLQSWAEDIGTSIANSVAKEYNPELAFNFLESFNNAWESGKQGMYASILFGGVGAISNTKMNISTQRKVHNNAMEMKSREEFMRQTIPLKPEGVTKANWKEQINEYYDKHKQIGATEKQYGNLTKDKAGKINSEIVNKEEPIDGVYEEDVAHYDETRNDKESVYGITKVKIDEDSKSVEIDKMIGYDKIELDIENIETLIDDIGERYAGYNLEFSEQFRSEIIDKDGTIITPKDLENIDNDYRIKANKNLGLNKFINNVSSDTKNLEQQIIENMPNTSRDEAIASSRLIGAMAERQGLTLDEFLQKNFIGGRLFNNNVKLDENTEGGKAQRAVSRGEANAVLLYSEKLGKSIIEVGKSGNLTTLIHEVMHANFITTPNDVKIISEALAKTKAEDLKKYTNDRVEIFGDINVDKAIKELTEDKKDYTVLSRNSHEFLGGLVEGYLADGKTFNKSLRGLMESIAKMFKNIYVTLRGKNFLNDDIVEAMDNLFDNKNFKDIENKKDVKNNKYSAKIDDKRIIKSKKGVKEDKLYVIAQNKVDLQKAFMKDFALKGSEIAEMELSENTLFYEVPTLNKKDAVEVLYQSVLPNFVPLIKRAKNKEAFIDTAIKRHYELDTLNENEVASDYVVERELQNRELKENLGNLYDTVKANLEENKNFYDKKKKVRFKDIKESAEYQQAKANSKRQELQTIGEIGKDILAKSKYYDEQINEYDNNLKTLKEEFSRIMDLEGRTEKELLKIRNQFEEYKFENEIKTELQKEVIANTTKKIDNLKSEFRKRTNKQDKVADITKKGRLGTIERVSKSTDDLLTVFNDYAKGIERIKKERAKLKKVYEYKRMLTSKIVKKLPMSIKLEQRKEIAKIQAEFKDKYKLKRVPRIMTVGKTTYNTADLKAYYNNLETKAEKEKYLKGLVSTYKFKPRHIENIVRESFLSAEISELENYQHEIERITDIGKIRKEMSLAERRNKLDEIANKMTRQEKEIAEEKGRDTGDNLFGSAEDKTARGGKKMNIKSTFWKTLTMERIAQKLDNNKKGIFYNTLVKQKRAIENKMRNRIDQRTKDVHLLHQKIKNEWYNRDIEIDFGDKIQTFSKDNLGFYYLGKDNEKTAKALKYGNLLTENERTLVKEGTESQVQDILALGEQRYDKIMDVINGLFDEDEIALLNAIKNDWNNEQTFDLMNEVFKNMYDKDIVKESNYVPMLRVRNNKEDIDKDVQNMINLAYDKGSGADIISTNLGFTKTRLDISNEYQAPIKTDLMNTYQRSVNTQEHFIAFAEYIRDMNSLMGKDKLINSIKQAHGVQAIKKIRNYLGVLSIPEGMQNEVDTFGFINKLRGNLGSAYLTYKTAGVVLQAITSPFPMFGGDNNISMLDFIKYLGNQEENHAIVIEKSSMMRHRSFSVIKQLQQEHLANAKSRKDMLLLKSQEIGMKGMELADRFSVETGWRAKYENEIAKGTSEQESVRLADELILRTQPHAFKSEMSELFRSNNAVAKALLQFTTSLNTIWNNLAGDIPIYLQQKQYTKVFTTILSYVMAGAILGLVQEGFNEDDDTKDKILKTAFYSSTQFIDSVPLIGSELHTGIQNLTNVWTGDRVYFGGRNFYPAVFELTKVPTKIAKGDWANALESSINTLSYVYGLPVSGRNELIDTLTKIKEGNLKGAIERQVGRRD